MCGCGAVKSGEERRGGEGWVAVEEVGRRERDVTTTFLGQSEQGCVSQRSK